MNLQYRAGNVNDILALKDLAIRSWSHFQTQLTEENWNKLKGSLENDETYMELVNRSQSLVCLNEKEEIVGMAFLVPSGNPTEIYHEDWCYIRFVSVDRAYSGKGIGKQLTRQCIEMAKKNGERIIALHTSEMMQQARHIYESLGLLSLKKYLIGSAKSTGFTHLIFNRPGLQELFCGILQYMATGLVRVPQTIRRTFKIR